MYNSQTILSILGVIATTCGVIAGFLSVLIPLASERRRRKYEIMNGRVFDISNKLKELKAKETLDIKDPANFIKKLENEEKLYTKVQDLLLNPKILKADICGITFPLSTLSIGFLLYDVLLFSASITYMVIIFFTGYILNWLIWVFLVLIIFNLIFLIPITYFSAVKDYNIDDLIRSASKNIK